MRTTLHDVLARQGHATNGYLALPGTVAAEIFARAGWDCVTLDMQHGLIGYEAAVFLLQALAAVDVVPMVRLPLLDPGLVGRLLDAGVLGLTCPMINNAADAERLVRASKYPPLGNRSLGPLRAALLDGDDYVARADAAISVFAMVETREGLEAVDDILAVSGIDGIYIGPGDFALSLGETPRPAGHAPAVEAAIDHIAARCRAHGKVAGIFAPDAAAGRRMVERGIRFVTLSSDARILAAGAAALANGLRGTA